MKILELPIISDEEVKNRYNKGWSFSNVYSLKAVRDIFILTFQIKEKKLSSIHEKLNSLKESEYKDWKKRKVLEYLNSLVNFNLVDSNYNCESNPFEKSIFDSELSEEEKNVFRDIFYNYFRFKELSSWFISPDKKTHQLFETFTKYDYSNHTDLLYYYSDTNRFTDSFLTNIYNLTSIYKINDEMSHLMRFWDVFLKWGVSLNIIEKFNLNKVSITIDNSNILSVAYFILPFKRFDLIDFCRQKFNSRHIRIPELIYYIAKEYRYPVSDIKKFLIEEVKTNDRLTYERTSEIFLIKGKTSEKKKKEATYLYPLINDSFISHLIIRK